MKLIDTHCHIGQEEFNSDREDVIKRADELGVHMISSGISPDSWDYAIEIGKKYSNVSASIGLDPLLMDEIELAMSALSKYQHDVVAVGEIGLDHYRERDHANREVQESGFRKMVSLALEYKLPIQVHSRSAGRSALGILSDMEAGLVHMHAFDGRASLARTASRDLGYYFSIPTSVVRSPQKQKLVKAINIERLLLETDSPVLGPVKGERNEPSNIWSALREVARLLRREEEEIREITLENTMRLYSRI
ncbi:MAG: TatD family hydrolase [Candidatus Hodarchaeota archaeon]